MSTSVEEVVAEVSRRVEAIVNNVQSAIQKLQESSFFEEATRQLQDPEMIARIKKVADQNQEPQCSQLQLVLYGVGSIEAGHRRIDTCLSQLAFAILLREKFEWVNDIVVYDPVMSPLQQEALKFFNCTFLSVDERGSRTVDRPTLFFMPRCPLPLFQNLLKANWTPANLNKIIILGNSFEMVKEYVPTLPFLRAFKHFIAILHSENIVHEVSLPIKETSDQIYREAFHEISWHFINLEGSIDDLNLDLYLEDTMESFNAFL